MNRQLQAALTASASSTLESMCFSMPEDNTASGAHCSEALGVAVQFEGDLAGTMQLAASVRAARELTASFLGADPGEVSQEGTYSVLLELANIICGATLSCYQKDGRFRLLSPQVLDSEPLPADCDAVCALQLEAGAVTAAIVLEQRA